MLLCAAAPGSDTQDGEALGEEEDRSGDELLLLVLCWYQDGHALGGGRMLLLPGPARCCWYQVVEMP